MPLQITYFSLFAVSIAAASVVVSLHAARRISFGITMLLAVAANALVISASALLAYREVQVPSSGHLEVNINLVTCFIVAPSIAGICAAFVSALMYFALRKHDSAI